MDANRSRLDIVRVQSRVLGYVDAAEGLDEEAPAVPPVHHDPVQQLPQGLYLQGILAYEEGSKLVHDGHQRLSPNPPMERDGRREDSGRGEGVRGAMIRARIWVEGRLAGGLQALLGGPMAAYSGCGEGDGRDRTRRGARGLGWREFAGTLGWLGGQWRTGAVRLGVEWLAVGPGRG